MRENCAPRGGRVVAKGSRCTTSHDSCTQSLHVQPLCLAPCPALCSAPRATGDAIVEAAAVAEGGPAAKVALLLDGYEQTLQDLLSQIITYWKVIADLLAGK